MAFSLEAFAKTRPYVYHLTSVANLEGIRARGAVVSAQRLMEESGDTTWLRGRRRGSKVIVLKDGEQVVLRDQDPLHEGNVGLARGWNFADYVQYLNARVFFWPGTDVGPIASGRNHFARYRSERPAILRLRALDLFQANAPRHPEFAKFNTGAPRQNNG